MTGQLVGSQRLPQVWGDATGLPAYRTNELSPTFFRLNAHVNYYFKNGLELYVGGENLTNYRQDRTGRLALTWCQIWLLERGVIGLLRVRDCAMKQLPPLSCEFILQHCAANIRVVVLAWHTLGYIQFVTCVSRTIGVSPYPLREAVHSFSHEIRIEAIFAQKSDAVPVANCLPTTHKIPSI